MYCQNWNEKIIGRLYDEITPADDAALEEHLAGCPRCRAEMDALRRVRTVLADDTPGVPRVPRVVVLRDRRRFRPAALAASLLAGAVLAGVGAGLGYAMGSRPAREAQPAVMGAATPGTIDVATEAMIRQEIDRRWAALQASAPSQVGGATSPRGSGAARSDAVTSAELRAELAKFERRWNGARAADLDYMLDQIQASEVRTGERIGKTNQALRYVALASNPNVSAQ